MNGRDNNWTVKWSKIPSNDGQERYMGVFSIPFISSNIILMDDEIEAMVEKGASKYMPVKVLSDALVGIGKEISS